MNNKTYSYNMFIIILSLKIYVYSLFFVYKGSKRDKNV